MSWKGLLTKQVINKLIIYDMKNLCITFISLLLITTSALTQDKTNRWIIKYDLISLLGDQVTNSMGMMLGFEHFLKNNSAISFDAMYIFSCACDMPYTRIHTEKTNGFSLSGEYRFYLDQGETQSTGFHLGPQFTYQYTQTEMRETYDGGIENFYQVYRELLAAHAVAGYQLRIAGPLVFDPSFGLGLRYISSRNENKEGTDSGQHEYLYNKDYESGSQWFPSFTINIKIGLKL